MRVAYFSPLPPERSGIADYSALLLPALRRRVDVAVARRGSKRLPRGSDVAVFHMGNDPEVHGWILEALERNRGIVVLHDFVLHHLVAGLTVGRGDGHAYLRAMEREAGVVGRLLGHGVLDKAIPPLWESKPEEWPLAAAALDYADGLIVHSAYVERRAREARFTGPIWRVQHPAWPIPSELPSPFVPTNRSPMIGSFGNLNPSKRVPQLLEAFARLKERVPDALLLLVGDMAPRLELESRIERLGLERERDLVQQRYVDENSLWSLMSACDICVSLRSPTMGETSGVAIRVLSLGRPLIVSDVGWFAELPDYAVAKVPVDEWEVDTLSAMLLRLAEDSQLRRDIGAAARRYAQAEHSLDRVADDYVAALEEAAGGDLVRASVLQELASAAADVGMKPDGPDIDELVRRLREARV